MILREEQLILETLVLWKGYFGLTSLTAPKGLTSSPCSPLHVFGADVLISNEKLVIGDTDSVLETGICRVEVQAPILLTGSSSDSDTNLFWKTPK